MPGPAGVTSAGEAWRRDLRAYSWPPACAGRALKRQPRGQASHLDATSCVGGLCNSRLQLTDQACCVRGGAPHLRRLPAAEASVGGGVLATYGVSRVSPLSENQKEGTLLTRAPTLTPLRIEIGGPGSLPYKSISELVWEDIPPLAVLTGVNGSGKTHLLELLAYKLTQTFHPELGDLAKVKLSVAGDAFSPDVVAFLPNRWDIPAVQPHSIAYMQNTKLNVRNDLQLPNTRQDMSRKARRTRIERMLGIKSLDELEAEKLASKLPDDLAFLLDDSDVIGGLTPVFLAYRLRAAEELEGGTTIADVPVKIGPAPWDVLNQTFQAAEFPYRVLSPMTTKMLEPYHLRLEDVTTGQQVRPMDLSSGEKTLLGLVIWLYKSQHHGHFPRLLLLDEPDAHLHPSMTRHFISVLKDVLVDRYGVRTILTTHSPSTVALAPDGSVFEMRRTAPRVSLSRSRADAIGLLTAGLVLVSPSSRFVLVEDELDVQFYSAVRDVLTDYGPSRDAAALSPAPTLVFLPASSGKNKDKIGGGCTVVVQWVEKFDQPPLERMFRGIIDRDQANTGASRVQVIGRYSVENYLLDPFVIFALLLEEGTAPTVHDVSISPGDEHRLRSLPDTQLQSVVVAIRSVLEPSIPHLTPDDLLPRKVSFTTGRSAEYPSWMLDRRGHDLLVSYQATLGGAKLVSPPRLLKTFRRVRLIPTELASILKVLQMQ